MAIVPMHACIFMEMAIVSAAQKAYTCGTDGQQNLCVLTGKTDTVLQT
jgi:hypothetical protein